MVLLFSSHNLHADSYSYEFEDASELSIWDVSDYVSDSFSDELMECSMDLIVNQDSKGKLTGGGSADCYIYIDDDGTTIEMKMTYAINGAITQKNGIANVSISIKFRGNAYAMGKEFKLSASEKVSAEINPYEKTIAGNVKVRVSVAGQRVSDTIHFYEPLPADMDGSFDLSFDANQAGKKLLGDASLILSNGDSYPFSVQGKTDVKKNTSQFTLKGDDEYAKGCKLAIKIDENNGDIISLKGKVLGQALNYP